MPEQPVALTEALLQIVHVVDAHGLQRSVQEHGAVEARGVMADLGDDVGVAKQRQRRDGVSGAREAARMPGLLGGTELQGGVAQGVRDEPGLEHGGVVDAAQAAGRLIHHRVAGEGRVFRIRFGEVPNAVAKGRGVLGKGGGLFTGGGHGRAPRGLGGLRGWRRLDRSDAAPWASWCRRE
jgi:hypothetical protein